jgi:hypothetical protein
VNGCPQPIEEAARFDQSRLCASSPLPAILVARTANRLCDLALFPLLCIGETLPLEENRRGDTKTLAKPLDLLSVQLPFFLQDERHDALSS